MKILLVNPYIYDFTAFDLWLRPLGLLYIASVIKKYTDCDIYWFDVLDRFSSGKSSISKKDGRGKYNREIVSKPSIYKNVPRNYSRYGLESEKFNEILENLPKIDIILFTSLMTYWIDGINYTFGKLKNRFPGAYTVLGGIIPTLIGSNFNGSENFDKLISGYGEEKILRFLAEKGCHIKGNPNFSLIDNLPFPANEFLGSKKYLPLLTSRGCPYRCTYCASHLLNKNFIQRNAESVYREISQMIENFDTEHFVIFDDALLINKKKRFFKIFSKVNNNFNVSFHTPNGLHAAEIDKETADVLFEAGFKTVRLSFESTNEMTLKKSSEKITLEDMISAVEKLTKAGFKKNEIECYLLFGLPGQNLKEIENSINFVKDMGIMPRLSYYSPVPGTKEYIEIVQSGILKNGTNLYQTNKIYFLYEKSGFSRSEIKYISELANISR